MGRWLGNNRRMGGAPIVLFGRKPDSPDHRPPRTPPWAPHGKMTNVVHANGTDGNGACGNSVREVLHLNYGGP